MSQGSGVDLSDIVQVVYAYQHPRLAGEGGQAVDHVRVDHLVGDHHVAHPAVDHGFGLADLLAADAHGAVGDLVQGDVRRLVCLGVCAVAQPLAFRVVRHASHVALVGVQVQKQAGGEHIVQGRVHGRRRYQSASASPMACGASSWMKWLPGTVTSA